MRKEDVVVTWSRGITTTSSLLKAMERSRIEQNGYKKILSKNGNLSKETNNDYSSNGLSSILDVYENIIKLIIGVSIAKSGIFKIFGAHAFLMYIVDPYNSARKWQKDIMLDASGHYGVPKYRDTRSDIVFPDTPSTISIDSYRRYFYKIKKEILYTYSYIIDEHIGQNIRNLILNNDKRSSFSCATKASYILAQTGLFQNIKDSGYPIDIKKYIDNFNPANKTIIDLLGKQYFDLEIYP
jgi:hypothetical protein